MKPKNQRLALLGLAMGALAGAGTLAVSAIGETATYFYAPSDVKAKPPAAGQAIRLGGMVEAGSVMREANGLTLTFRVTDNAETVPVKYRGIAPDLFREKSGVVAEGRFDADGTFIADTLLAKHDEKYMPPQVAGAMRKSAGGVK